jgi:phage terminase small subunit
VALTAKQKIFVQEYLVDLNATQAAIRAGYSPKTANRTASENLSKPDIQAAIHKSMQKREKRVEVNQDYVISKLFEITEKEASDMPESDLKYGNKIKAIELLGKHVGAWDRKDDKNKDAVIEGIKALADIVKKPQPDRDIKDFEE